MPAVLTCQHVKKAFGIHVILEDVSFAVDEGERIGIVGLNGAGKSTLLRTLVEDDPDAGLITRKRDQVLRYVAQEPKLDPDATIATELARATRAEPHEREEFASRLSLPPLDIPIHQLSIGERRRVAIARAMLDRPDLLALDEPTNHLDLGAVEWLEKRLKSWAGTVLIVTHDRTLLDEVATRILEVEGGRVMSYPGNYTEFLFKQAERKSNEAETERVRSAFVRRELEWVRRKPGAQRKQDSARLARFDAALDSAPAAGRNELELRLPPPDRLGKTVLEARKLGRKGRTGWLFQDVNFALKKGDRVGILGPNGAGKTTLLRTLIGQLAPEAGEVEVGVNTKFSWLDQGRSELRDDHLVIDEIGGGSSHVRLAQGDVHVRSFLRLLGFNDQDATKRVGTLSGGERNRLQLARLLKSGGNVLVLDEPTNDLDLITLGILEDALSAYEGCCLVVSHDRWFLDRIANRILAFDEGRVVDIAGNYTAWRAWREAQAEDRRGGKSGDKPADKAAEAPLRLVEKKRLSYREQQELAGMERAVELADAKVVEVEARLGRASGAEVARVSQELADAMAEVDRLWARWQELEARA